MKKTLLLFIMALCTNVLVLGQIVQITGTVTSKEDGLPMPGVTVLVKETTVGTVTDVDGKYTINVPASATELEFRFVGMKTLILPINGQKKIDAVMQAESQLLNEVVVSAFGIKRNASEIGSSITKVGSEQLNQAKITNAATALTSKVSGLQINTVSNSVDPSVRVVLRGNRSFLGNNQALLVLDGSPVNLAYLSTLNPNDIESMSILKGANAAALYGSDAANGVIIVNTKMGSKDRAVIQYSNTTTIEKVAFFPKLQTRFGSGSTTDQYGNPLYIPFENQSYGPEYNGEMVQIGLDDEYGRPNMVKYEALPKEKINFWDTGLTMQNDLSFSSGNENSSLYISLQDVNIHGVVPGDKARRDVVRINGSKTYKSFTASFNFNYTYKTQDITRSGVYWNVLNTPGHIPLTKYKNWNANLGVDKDGIPITNWGDINHYFNAYYPNPYEEIDRLRHEQRDDYVSGVLDLKEKATKWLTLEVRSAIAPNFTYYENKNYSRTFSDYALRMYTEKGRSISKANIPSAYGSKDSWWGLYQGMGWRFTNDFLATVENKFNNFSVKAILGATSRDSYSKYLASSAFALEIQDFFNLDNVVGNLDSESYWYKQRSLGVFGDVTLGYHDYAYIHFSGRNDWNSLLDPSNWSFFYPGVDVSLVLSDMIPSLKSNTLNYAKLRGGVSKVGTINVDNYSLENTFGIPTGFPFGSLSSYSVSNQLNNRYLNPEFTLSKEIGLDLGFLDNRIEAHVTAYQTNTTNQTVNMDISTASGYSKSKINTGEILNRGVESDFKFVPIANNNFRWEVNLNYTYYYSKVLSLTPDLDEISLGNYVYAMVGKAYPMNKATKFTEDSDGHVIVDAKSGMPSIDALTYPTGQTTPKYIAGLQTSITWKNFNLSISADYRGGHVMRTDLYYDLLFSGVGALSVSNGRERFVFPNSVYKDANGDYVKNTNVAVQDGGVAWWTNTMRSLSYYSVINAAAVKIREISLGYDVPSSMLNWSNGSISSVRLSLVGKNLFMFLPKNNIYCDPEFNNDNSNAVGYSTGSQTPATRQYGFNVTFTF